MKKIYLTNKQMLYVMGPLVFGVFMFISPASSEYLIDTISDVNASITKEQTNYSNMMDASISKSFREHFENLKTNHMLVGKNTLMYEKDDLLWSIAHFYDNIETPDINSPESKVGGSRLTHLSKLQSVMNQRNMAIEDMVGTTPSAKDEDYQKILEIIRSRNLAGTGGTNDEIGLKGIDDVVTTYKVQMIFYDGKNSTVIINNRIVELNQSIDDYAQLLEIRQDRVLIQRNGETQWLHLLD